MKKSISFIVMAAAVVLMSSCNREDTAWRKLTPEENMDRISTTMAEAVDKLSPMYASTAVKDAQYFSEHVSDYNMDVLSDYFAKYKEKHTTNGKEMTSEQTAIEVTTMVISLADLKGHFSVVDSAWVRKNASNLVIELPYEGKSNLTLTLNATDSGEIVTTDEDEDYKSDVEDGDDVDDDEEAQETPYLDRTQLNIPKTINATLKQGEQVVVSVKVSATAKIGGDGEFNNGDKLTCKAEVVMGSLKFVISSAKLTTSDISGRVMAYNRDEKVLDLAAEFNGLTTEEGQSGINMSTPPTNLKVDVDILGQLAGSFESEYKTFMALQDSARSVSNDVKKVEALAEEANKYVSGYFYLDGHKNNKQAEVKCLIEYYDGQNNYYFYPGLKFADDSQMFIDDMEDYLMNEGTLQMHIQLWVYELRYLRNGSVPRY